MTPNAEINSLTLLFELEVKSISLSFSVFSLGNNSILLNKLSSLITQTHKSLLEKDIAAPRGDATETSPEAKNPPEYAPQPRSVKTGNFAPLSATNRGTNGQSLQKSGDRTGNPLSDAKSDFPIQLSISATVFLPSLGNSPTPIHGISFFINSSSIKGLDSIQYNLLTVLAKFFIISIGNGFVLPSFNTEASGKPLAASSASCPLWHSASTFIRNLFIHRASVRSS